MVDLNIPEEATGRDGITGFTIACTADLFSASVKTAAGEQITINEDGLIIVKKL